LIFYNKNWTAAATFHEVISYIKARKNSILQVHTFCSTVVYYRYSKYTHTSI